MPSIPVYQEHISNRAAPVGQSVVPGQGMAAIGRALGDVASNLAEVARQDDLVDVATGEATLREKATQAYIDAQTSAAPDADKFTAGVGETFDKVLGDVSKTLRSRRAEQILRDRARVLKSQYLERAMGWEAEQRIAYRKNAVLQNVDRLRTAVELDPDQWEPVVATQAIVLDSLPMAPAERYEMQERVYLTLAEAAATGIAKRQPEIALRNLATLESGDSRFDRLTGDARRRVEQTARTQVVTQLTSDVLSAYESQGPEAGVEALAAVQARADIPAELRAEIRSKVNSGVTQLRQQRREEHVEALTAVESAISTGAAGATTHAEVEKLYQAGALSPAEAVNYHAAIDGAIVRRSRESASALLIQNALSQGLPLDPKDSEHRKALSAAFAQDVAGEQPGSVGWQATAQAYASRARMLPDQAYAWTRQAMRSPDPALAANAAQFYGAVQATTPDAVREFDQDTRAFAGVVNSMIEAGAASERAVETARAIVFDVKPEIREQRQATFRRDFLPDQAGALDKLIDRDFDPGIFSRQPAASVALSADFDAQTERYFTKVGDIELARTLAWQDVTRVYGPSRVNGDPMMIAFPPERFGITPEEIRSELSNFLKGNPQADGSGAEDILIVPDALTLRSVGNALNGETVQPSYRLVTKSGDLVVDRKGVPIRYTLPGGEELTRRLKEVRAAADLEARQEVEKARGTRDARRRMRSYYQRQGEIRLRAIAEATNQAVREEESADAAD